jgi:tetratricopeptide (TPR) repeat protein
MRVTIFICAFPLIARGAGVEVDPDTEIARRHFAQAVDFYERGEYQSAIDEWKAADAVKPAAEISYNIARCYDRLELPQKAIASYLTFLEKKPDAAQAEDVRQRVEALRKRHARADERMQLIPAPDPPLPTDEPEAEPEPQFRPQRRWSGGEKALLAVSVVAGIGAVALMGAGGAILKPIPDELSAIRATCTGKTICDSSTTAPERAQANLGVSLLGAAAAVAALDLVLWGVFGAIHKRAKAKRAEAHASFNQVWVGGRF